MCTVESSYQIISEPATYSAIAAIFSAIAAIFSYSINRKSLSSKISDRLYEINKLIMSNPEVFNAFVTEAHRLKEDYFEITSEKDRLHVQLKSLVYFYLNLFEEMFIVYETKLPFVDHTWKALQHYIFKRLRHPLIKEVVLAECNFTIDGQGGLVRISKESCIFDERFISFLEKNYEKWRNVGSKRVW